MHPLWGLLVAYVLGSLPFAYLVGRARGVDLRHHGSGNLGATNAARVLGVRTGASVYVLDTLKGFVAAFFLPRILAVDPVGTWAVLYGVAVVLGHVRPVFLGFQRAGKGVATAGGVFFGLAPVATLIVLGVWLMVFVAGGYVSAASLAAAVALPIVLILRSGRLIDAVTALALALTLFVFWTHLPNMRRLVRGEEHRFHAGVRGRWRATPRRDATP